MQLHKFSLLKPAKSSPQFPLFPYKRPMTKAGFFKKYEYAYDEYYDCYICPNNEVLEYSTTNREGYKEYKSKGYLCEKCPYVGRCTESKEKIERLFGTAKENHGFRYTQMYGKARMELKAGLTFACLNLKKLVGILKRKRKLEGYFSFSIGIVSNFQFT